MTRIVLHIGPHKTGTSSFQRWLVENADALLERKVAFPVDIVGKTGNGARLAQALNGTVGLDPTVAESLIRRFDEFRQAHADCTIIISAEFFAYLLQAEKGEVSLRSAPLIETRNNPRLDYSYSLAQNPLVYQSAVANLHSKLVELGFSQCDVVFTVREPSQLIGANHLQQFKKFRFRLNFEKLGLNDLPVRRYAKAAQTLANQGFGISHVSFYDKQRSVPLIQRIWETARLPNLDDLPNAFQTKDTNISPGYLTAIGIGHIYALLERNFAQTGQAMSKEARNDLLAATESFSAAGDRRLNLFTQDGTRALRDRLNQNIAGIEDLSNGPTQREIIASLSAPVDQSPLSWAALNKEERQSVREWLHEVAARTRSNPNLRDILPPQSIRRINETTPGIHSSGVLSAPALF